MRVPEDDLEHARELVNRFRCPRVEQSPASSLRDGEEGRGVSAGDQKRLMLKNQAFNILPVPAGKFLQLLLLA